jgi:hypothetical protein
MLERKVFCRLEWLVRGVDKPTASRPLQAMAAMGRVKIADTDYGHHVLTQLLQFPAGKHDDAADMAALMGMAIDQAHPGLVVPTTEQKRPPRDRYEKPEHEDSWRVA